MGLLYVMVGAITTNASRWPGCGAAGVDGGKVKGSVERILSREIS